MPLLLLNDLGDDSSSDSPSSLPHVEPQTLLHSNGRDELDVERGIISRHNHFGSLLEVEGPGDVRGTEEELGSVIAEEGGVPPSLVLGEHVALRLELLSGGDGSGRRKDLATADVLALGSAEESTNVVTSHSRVQELFEHLHSFASGRRGRRGVSKAGRRQSKLVRPEKRCRKRWGDRSPTEMDRPHGVIL